MQRKNQLNETDQKTIVRQIEDVIRIHYSENTKTPTQHRQDIEQGWLDIIDAFDIATQQRSDKRRWESIREPEELFQIILKYKHKNTLCKSERGRYWIKTNCNQQSGSYHARTSPSNPVAFDTPKKVRKREHSGLAKSAQVLGVSVNATPRRIRRAFKTKARKIEKSNRQ